MTKQRLYISLSVSIIAIATSTWWIYNGRDLAVAYLLNILAFIPGFRATKANILFGIMLFSAIAFTSAGMHDGLLAARFYVYVFYIIWVAISVDRVYLERLAVALLPVAFVTIVANLATPGRAMYNYHALGGIYGMLFLYYTVAFSLPLLTRTIVLFLGVADLWDGDSRRYYFLSFVLLVLNVSRIKKYLLNRHLKKYLAMLFLVPLVWFMAFKISVFNTSEEVLGRSMGRRGDEELAVLAQLDDLIMPQVGRSIETANLYFSSVTFTHNIYSAVIINIGLIGFILYSIMLPYVLLPSMPRYLDIVMVMSVIVALGFAKVPGGEWVYVIILLGAQGLQQGVKHRGLGHTSYLGGR